MYPIFAPDWPGYEKLLYSDPGTQECIMAFKGDKLVGHAAITRREVKLKDGLTEVIGGAGDLAVAEECRGLGIGRELDLKCKEIMKESGYNLGLIFCHGDVEAHHKANGWLEKEKGSVWATVDKEIRPQEIAMYWPIKMSEEEKDIWKNGDIYIGEGNW